MHIKNICSMVILLFSVACTMNEGTPTVSPTNTVAAYTPSAPLVTAVPAETSEAGLTVTATVKDIALSARVIFLMQPVDGFNSVALAGECQLITEDGSEISLQEIQPGFTIQAFGQPGGSNALLASKVVVIKK